MMAYTEYKKSLYPFDRRIPSHWEETYLSRAYSLKSVTGHADEDLLSVFLDKGVINYNESDKKQVHKPSEDMSKYQLVEPGDFVMNNQQAWRGSVGVSKYRGIISPAYYIWAPRNDYNPKYMNFMLRDKDIVDQFVLASKGVGSIQRQIYVPYMKTTVLAIPPREEQDQIVRYLDWQLSKINKLIHGYQREIKLLEERKRTLVDKAVTKGLVNTAEMKDSGVYWLGEIPKSWGLMRAKYLFKKEKREPLPNDEVVTCFRDGEVTLRKNRRTTGFTESLQENGYQHVCKGDLVIHVMDAFAGAIGISDSDGKGTPVYHCCTPLSKDVYVPYYMYFLRMMAHTGYIQSLYRGIRERSTNFTFDVFSAQMLSVPPIEEQKAIVDYIDNKTNQINLLKERITKQIDLLKEYRTRLISDVVTGQMDVRGIEIPDYTPEEDTEETDEENKETEVNADAESDE